jgi:manganese/iron transport system permease protein/iron/zinc/copper transport system permease protein
MVGTGSKIRRLLRRRPSSLGIPVDVLIEPFTYSFFGRGMLASALAGGLCGLLGVYITLRGMSYIGHGLSHAIFGGAVVSYLLGINFYLGAGAWGFVSGLLINAVARSRRIAADAAIGIVTTASFAIGVALISKARSFTKNFEAALFGNILGVTEVDLMVLAGVTMLAVMIVFGLYKQLLFVTFDPEVAPAYGVSVDRVDTLFALILAAAVIASMQVLGVTMIAAAIVIPAVSVRLLTNHFGTLLVSSAILGAACGVVGMYASYYLDVSSGATIVLVAATVFVLALLISRVRATADAREPVRIGEV